MVDGDVGLLEDRCQLELVGRHLVVTSLARDAKLKRLNLKILHERLHTLGDSTEVVVVHLLVFSRVVAHERTTGEHKVGACRVESLVNEEVLLLPTEVRDDLLHLRVEVVADSRSRLVHGVERTQERSLIVERLAGVRDEDGRDTERVVDDEHRRCGVPSRIAACLEGVAYAAVRERACVRLLLYEQLARELLYHSALAVVLDEGVVLLGCALGERLEPVCVVSDAVLVCPLLHAFSHSVGYRAVETRTVVDDIDELFVHFARKILVHLRTVEHVLAEELRRTFYRRNHFNWFLVESLGYNLKS